MNDFRYDKPTRSLIPAKPGYYWAKWKIAADGTHEGDELTPAKTWEIVQVNANVLGWEDDPADDEALSVSVPGVRETQWRDCFVWGPLVAPLAKFGELYPAAATHTAAQGREP